MYSFSYERCGDLAEALRLLGQEGTVLLAGGTDLLVSIRQCKIKPRHVLDIKDIPEFQILEEREEGILIGACVSLNDIANASFVQKNIPILAEGCHSIGSYSIRNRGTLGGNICNASPAADSAPSLYCLGAMLNIVGPEGERCIPIEEFFVGPGKTALQAGELLSSIFIPKPYPDGKGVYLKSSRTGSVDLATVGVAVQAGTAGVRVAVGAVARTPVRARGVEEAINEKQATDWSDVANLVENDIAPIDDLRGSQEFRFHLAKVLVRRGLEATMEV